MGIEIIKKKKSFLEAYIADRDEATKKIDSAVSGAVDSVGKALRGHKTSPAPNRSGSPVKAAPKASAAPNTRKTPKASRSAIELPKATAKASSAPKAPRQAVQLPKATTTARKAPRQAVELPKASSSPAPKRAMRQATAIPHNTSSTGHTKQPTPTAYDHKEAYRQAALRGQQQDWNHNARKLVRTGRK